MCTPYPLCPSQADYYGLGTAWEFESDSDIAGIGVITSFLVYSILTTLIASYAFFLADGVVPEEYYNQLDVLIHKIVQGFLTFMNDYGIIPLFRKISSHIRLPACFLCLRPRHGRIFTIRPERLQSICLQLADVQLITGAAILIVLYTTHCTITQYHFYIGSQLAYLSFVTFQAIFMTITDQLQPSLLKRLWRYLWLLVLFGAVISTKIVTWNSYFLNLDLYGASVQCTLDKITEGWDTKSAGYVAVECFFLSWSLWAITLSLFPILLTDWDPLVRLVNFIHRPLSWPSVHLLRSHGLDDSRLVKFFWTVIFFITIPCREFIFSAALDLLRVYIMLIYGGKTIIYQRQVAAHQGREGDEDEWGFGQVLPVLLLAIPLAQFMEELLSRKQETPDTGENTVTDESEMASFSGNPIFRTNPVNDDPAAPYNGRVLSRVRTSPSQLTRRQTTFSRIAHTSTTGNRPVRRVVSSSGAQALMAAEEESESDEMRAKTDKFEKEMFRNKIFQAWIILLFCGVYGILTWISIYFEVPV